METKEIQNPLAVEKVGKLIAKFAVPAVVSGLVSALYNIADQIFIGQSVGILGNAATNVAFPLVTIATSAALLLGVGSASNFSLELGRGNPEKAGKVAGNGIFFLTASGIVLLLLVLLLLDPLLVAFGASTPEVLGYAKTYTGITALGIPFFILSIGGSHIIRADGSPRFAMVSTLLGAVLNVGLDALFIFGFDMGIAGAAWATVIGQWVSGILNLVYFTRFHTMKLSRAELRPRARILGAISSLGAAACFNQLAMCAVQIALNSTLSYYGALSPYGSEIPLACVGIVAKVNFVFITICIGIAQGCQPINGFNYGAGNFRRVRETLVRALGIVSVVSIIAFLLFQIFPRPIIQIFGEGNELYLRFGEAYFRIYMFMAMVNGIQPLTSNFFTSIGKAKTGILLSLTRQILFLLPLVLVLPMLFGIDGVMYAGPVADGAAFLFAAFLLAREWKKMGRAIAVEKEEAVQPAE